MNDIDHISIVLAVYNGERFLREQIDSILHQTSVFIHEFIIVNDCSTDDSLNIVNQYREQYPFINILNNEKNIGPIGSFIKGASYATCKYIAFADQDDIWVENKIEQSLNLIKQIDINDKPAVVFTDLALIDEKGIDLKKSFWQLYDIHPSENSFFSVLFANIITGCTMVINRQMLRELISMPLTAQMHDHWIALVAFAFGDLNYSYNKTVLYRVHNNSVTSKDKVTTRQVIFNFLEATFNPDSIFLKKYIDQAILFKNVYADKLDDRQVKQLNYFIGLGNSSGFIKKLNSKLRFTLSKWI